MAETEMSTVKLTVLPSCDTLLWEQTAGISAGSISRILRQEVVKDDALYMLHQCKANVAFWGMVLEEVEESADLSMKTSVPYLWSLLGYQSSSGVGSFVRTIRRKMRSLGTCDVKQVLQTVPPCLNAVNMHKDNSISNGEREIGPACEKAGLRLISAAADTFKFSYCEALTLEMVLELDTLRKSENVTYTNFAGWMTDIIRLTVTPKASSLKSQLCVIRKEASRLRGNKVHRQVYLRKDYKPPDRISPVTMTYQHEPIKHSTSSISSPFGDTTGKPVPSDAPIDRPASADKVTCSVKPTAVDASTAIPASTDMSPVNNTMTNADAVSTEWPQSADVTFEKPVFTATTPARPASTGTDRSCDSSDPADTYTKPTLSDTSSVRPVQTGSSFDRTTQDDASFVRPASADTSASADISTAIPTHGDASCVGTAPSDVSYVRPAPFDTSSVMTAPADVSSAIDVDVHVMVAELDNQIPEKEKELDTLSQEIAKAMLDLSKQKLKRGHYDPKNVYKRDQRHRVTHAQLVRVKNQVEELKQTLSNVKQSHLNAPKLKSKWKRKAHIAQSPDCGLCAKLNERVSNLNYHVIELEYENDLLKDTLTVCKTNVTSVNVPLSCNCRTNLETKLGQVYNDNVRSVYTELLAMGVSVGKVYHVVKTVVEGLVHRPVMSLIAKSTTSGLQTDAEIFGQAQVATKLLDSEYSTLQLGVQKKFKKCGGFQVSSANASSKETFMMGIQLQEMARGDADSHLH